MAEQRTSSSNNDHLLRDQVVDITSSVNNNNYTNRDNDDDSPQNNRDGQQPPMSRSNVLIGILSQITLAITFVSLLYSKDDVAFIKKNMWTALILGCFVHILCNFVFYKSVIVPASNSPSYLALKTKLCDDNYDEENNVADNEDRATRRVHHRSYASWDISFSSVVTFFLLVNVVSFLHFVSFHNTYLGLS